MKTFFLKKQGFFARLLYTSLCEESYTNLERWIDNLHKP